MGHGLIVDQLTVCRRDGDFAGNESVVIHVHGCRGLRASVDLVLREARGGRQSSEQDASLKREECLALATTGPEGVRGIAAKCIESRTVKTISLFQLKPATSEHVDPRLRRKHQSER